MPRNESLAALEKRLANPFLRLEGVQEAGEALVRLAPGLVRMEELGRSRQGRPIPLLVLHDAATGSDRDKPAIYLHGQVHSHELSGCPTILQLACQLLRANRTNGVLQRVAFYLVPRINPDGVEEVLAQRAGCNRSRFDDSDRTRPNTWVQQDVNSDGRILELRRKDPCGAWAIHPGHPQAMIARTSESRPPFYRVGMEGVFLNYDGSAACRSGEGAIDFNRNYGGSWSAEQPGAGAYPFSEPETRAVAEFFATHPNLFCAFDLHNGPLQLMAPPAVQNKPILPTDHALFQRVFGLSRNCGIPASTLYLYPDPQQPHDSCGNFVDWAYFDCGLLGWCVELGTIVDSVIGEEAARRFDGSREIQPKILQWQEEHPEEPLRLHPWRVFQHPQLGEVEIGGIEPQTMSLPAREHARAISRRLHRLCLQLAEMAPRLQIVLEVVEKMPNRRFRIRGRLHNAGGLSTAVTARGAALPTRKAPYLEFRPAKGIVCLSADAGQECAHLPPLGSEPFEWVVEARKAPVDGLLGEILCRGGAGGSSALAIRTADHPATAP